MESHSSKNMGYRLVSGTNLRIESKSIVADRTFNSLSSLRYVTHILDNESNMPLTPMFSALTYDEDTDTFLIRDDIELPDHLVHIYFALDTDLNIIGNCIYNDYFDSTDYISGLGTLESDFFPYRCYKGDVVKEINHDKKRRDEEHKRIQEELILKHIHTKRSDFDES